MKIQCKKPSQNFVLSLEVLWHLKCDCTIPVNNCKQCGPGTSVGIATDYGLDGPGIECRWGRDCLPFQTGPGAHSASCKLGTGSFPGVKCGREVLLTTQPLPGPRSWKSRAIPLPNLWATTGPVTGLLYCKQAELRFSARCVSKRTRVHQTER